MSLLRSATRCIANQTKYERLNAFVSRALEASVLRQVELAEAQHEHKPLSGRLVAIKDNICTKTLPTTAASNILRNFTSPYDATVVSRLQDAGAIVAGKTNLDEFGMGSHSLHSHAGAISQSSHNENGREEALSAGGSSGGSAVAVATEQCWAALGTDTGGSVRLPAAYTGTVGFKPSYGLISRWGVIAYANSLDTVGVLSRSVSDANLIFKALARYDAKDPTSVPEATRTAIASHKSSRKNLDTLRIGIPAEYNITELSSSVRSSWRGSLAALTQYARDHLKKEVELVPVSLPTTQQALSAYYVLAPAEASSNLAKYDGVRYGSRTTASHSDAEGGVLFAQTRGEGLGDEVRRRILLGTYSLSASAIDNYFVQAQRVRRLVQRDFDRVFEAPNPLLQESKQQPGEKSGVNVLIHPTAPTTAPLLEEVKKQSSLEAYTNDVFTVPASLAGLPAISVPVPCNATDRNNAFCGMQVVGQFGQDDLVLDVAQMLESAVHTFIEHH